MILPLDFALSASLRGGYAPFLVFKLSERFFLDWVYWIGGVVCAHC
ncbi:hypothetical protein HAL09_04250 [Helicobacter ailurogastricus]|uniref:Uncharacterized protein n=1 Tax=Helicobacter ailurogastricus TaxID=1578720 RepID=A0A0K2XGQ3_9HELI|nr:hypothetical protein HAL011_08720 [Helicobacter ailurogastricus]CRF43869.1 hypothetical protein HAL09_04250 [Helicobacter ailurogastricus]